jgi:hypothetical protein
MPPTDYPPLNRPALVRAAINQTAHILKELTPAARDVFALRLAGLLATVWPSSHDAELLDALKDEGARLL